MESWPWIQRKRISRSEGIGLFLFAIGHALAAYFSFGYNHPDEHFQILEFAAHLSGVSSDPSVLPWEFHARIRPWFQPMIHAIVMKPLSWAGAYQPFSLAAAFRCFYAFLNLVALWNLWTVFKTRFRIDPRWFLLIGTLWFFPYLHVRSSSENLSGILLTFAFARLLSEERGFATGALFGFAFLARFQIALGLGGMALALLIRERRLTSRHFRLLAGFLGVTLFGVILDRIGYGSWVFTPYLYFKVNLIDGVAATYNPYPWYQYFLWILQLNPLISVPLFFGVFLYAKKERIDPMAWFVISFFLVLLFITNKEYRFLFPVMNLAVFMAIRAYQGAEKRFFAAPSLLAYSIASLLGFSISSLHGASLETLWSIHMVDRYGTPGETWLSNRDFVQQFRSTYYRIDQVKVKLYATSSELETLLAGARPVRVLIDGKLSDAETGKILDVFSRARCRVESSALPGFLFDWKEKIPAIQRITYRALYVCP